MTEKNLNEPDVNEMAFQVVHDATNPKNLNKAQISQIMAHMGRKGGLKGGKARALSLTPKQRKMIAKKAAKKRWETKGN